MKIDLYNGEYFFICTVRYFNFLRKCSYFEKEFSTGGREPYVTYNSSMCNRNIVIFWSETDGKLDMIISRNTWKFGKKQREFYLKEYIHFFNKETRKIEICNNIYDEIKAYAYFIQQHIMPVIKGEMWIDELVKLKEKERASGQ